MSFFENIAGDIRLPIQIAKQLKKSRDTKESATNRISSMQSCTTIIEANDIVDDHRRKCVCIRARARGCAHVYIHTDERARFTSTFNELKPPYSPF